MITDLANQISGILFSFGISKARQTQCILQMVSILITFTPHGVHVNLRAWGVIILELVTHRGAQSVGNLAGWFGPPLIQGPKGGSLHRKRERSSTP